MTTNMPEFKFGLGDELTDTITGFVGVCIGQHHWLNNCNTYSLQSRIMKDGMPQNFVNFDEPQLTMVAAKIMESHPETGGPDRPVQRPGH